MPVEQFLSRGHPVRKYTTRPAREFIVSVDLGFSVDSTVVCVGEFHVVGLGEFDVQKSTGPNYAHIMRERYREQLDIREIQRLKLMTRYTDISDYIIGLMSKEPLIGADLAIDAGNAGVATIQMIEERSNLSPLYINSTGGNEANKTAPRRWSVPKHELVGTLQAMFVNGEIKLAHNLPHLETLREEVSNFQRRYTATGRATFDAAVGHDDIVSSLAILAWTSRMLHSPSPGWSQKRGGDFSVSFVRGMY
jgi:hypothetical protein